MFRNIVSILLATLWISVSEFFRNQYLFKSAWINHYKSLGLIFPVEPVNGGVWGAWSFVMALMTFFSPGDLKLRCNP